MFNQYPDPPQLSLKIKGPFINYVRVPREREGWKNLYILIPWGGEGVKPILT